MMKLLFFLFFMFFNLMILNKKLLYWYNFYMLLILNLMFMNSMNYNYYWMNLYNWMSIDMISMPLVMLSIWILSLMFLVSMKMKWNKFYNLILLFLLMMLVMSFISMNYFLFYIFFEVSLIPTFLLIMGWGYQPERIGASMYMILYTLFASLPLLILLYYLYNNFYTLNFMFILNKLMFKNMNFEFLFYLYMIFAFLVKLPMYMFHMWLPKAHIEAPVTGSMILAGVMLKLGGYGVMRSMLMMMNYSMKYNYIFILLSLFGMIYLSLVCLRLTDVKLIVAYSSVVHMGMMLMGLMSMFYIGYLGGLMMMLAHGLCSSAMFMLVNYFYELVKTRNIYLNKGMIYLVPSLVMWWFMFCIANMSAPITLNLMSELMIVMVLIDWSFDILLFLMLGMYLSACYSLYLFSYLSHGKVSNLFMNMMNKSSLNYLSLLVHWIPLNFIILKMEVLI